MSVLLEEISNMVLNYHTWRPPWVLIFLLTEWKTELRSIVCLLRQEAWSVVWLVGLSKIHVSVVSLCHLLLFKRSATVMDSQKEGQRILFTAASGNYSRDLLPAQATVLFFSAPVNPTSLLVNMAMSAIFPHILTSHLHYIGPFLRPASCWFW